MWNGLEVMTKQLDHSEQQHWSFQMLPDAPTQVECKAQCSQVLQDYFQVLLNASEVVEQNTRIS